MTSVSKTTWLNVGLILCGLFTRAQAADCPQVPEDYVVEHDGLKVYRDNPLDRCCRLENGDIWRQDQGEAWPRDRLVIDWSGFKAKTGNLDGYALSQYFHSVWSFDDILTSAHRLFVELKL